LVLEKVAEENEFRAKSRVTSHGADADKAPVADSISVTPGMNDLHERSSSNKLIS
jgi:hypothetical protein